MNVQLINKVAAIVFAGGFALVVPGAAVAAPWDWTSSEKPVAQATPQLPYGVPAPAQPTWGQRITAPFTPSYWTGKPSAPNGSAPGQFKPQIDPLSLGFGSGEPTPELYAAMADMAARGGNTQQARDLYQKSLSMNKKCVAAYLGMARLEDRENRLAQAASIYQTALNYEPNNTTVLNDFALCLARQGKLNESYQLLRRAINIEPTKELYRNNMAKVLIEMNRFDEAMANLNSVHTKPVAQYNMGVLLQQRGRYAESMQYLSGALALEPRMEPARMLLTRASEATRRAAPGQAVAQLAQRPNVTPPQQNPNVGPALVYPNR